MPVLFRMAAIPQGTLGDVASFQEQTLFAAGMLDGPDIGFIPFSTTIVAGGAVSGSPILCPGFNAFQLNFLSTNAMIQGFAVHCRPDNSTVLSFLGDAATVAVFDEAVGVQPWLFGAFPGFPGEGDVWHTFRLTLYNPDVNDAQIQFCELYANPRTAS